MAKPPSKRSSSSEIADFLGKSKFLATAASQRGRLLFAIDATASRQPTWDRASHLQREMFSAAGSGNNLSIQLCYFRGYREFFASPWVSDGDSLGRQMSAVSCLGGHTQIERLLRHGLAEHRKQPIAALVFIGDAMEESADTLCDLAGQCRLAGLPLFLFQEGNSGLVRSTFGQMARLSGGAYAQFDSHSAARLAELLGAVARYASGGAEGLKTLGSDSAKLLLQQLKP